MIVQIEMTELEHKINNCAILDKHHKRRILTRNK